MAHQLPELRLTPEEEERIEAADEAYVPSREDRYFCRLQTLLAEDSRTHCRLVELAGYRFRQMIRDLDYYYWSPVSELEIPPVGVFGMRRKKSR